MIPCIIYQGVVLVSIFVHSNDSAKGQADVVSAIINLLVQCLRVLRSELTRYIDSWNLPISDLVAGKHPISDA